MGAFLPQTRLDQMFPMQRKLRAISDFQFMLKSCYIPAKSGGLCMAQNAETMLYLSTLRDMIIYNQSGLASTS